MEIRKLIWLEYNRMLIQEDIISYPRISVSYTVAGMTEQWLEGNYDKRQEYFHICEYYYRIIKLGK